MQSPLLLTITPNPSIDLLFEHERLVWDDANRTAMPRRRAGGQGINVVRALRVLGGEGVALALLGGEAGAELQHIMEREGTRLHRVAAEGETRVFVAARERASGRSLLLNPRGPQSSGRSGEALCRAAAALQAELRPGWVACCGSIPPGVPTDTYARIGARAREHGARFVPDCDGELLRQAVAAGCDLLVPNQHEAERLAGCTIGSVADAGRVAGELRRGGVDVACITLGEDGAVLACAAGCWHAWTDAEPRGSAVGAGDAFLAALLLAMEREEKPPTWLEAGVAAGAAVLQSEGGDLLTLQEYRRQRGRVRWTELR